MNILQSNPIFPLRRYEFYLSLIPNLNSKCRNSKWSYLIRHFKCLNVKLKFLISDPKLLSTKFHVNQVIFCILVHYFECLNVKLGFVIISTVKLPSTKFQAYCTKGKIRNVKHLYCFFFLRNDRRTCSILIVNHCVYHVGFSKAFSSLQFLTSRSLCPVIHYQSTYTILTKQSLISQRRQRNKLWH